MRTLEIDIETYSATDLKSSGVYKYVEDPHFEILLLAYCIDNGKIQIIDKPNKKDDIIKLLTDPSILKTAYNANFERTCLAKFFNINTDPAQWQCTMVSATMLGLPSSLEQCARVLKLQDQKSASGKALIKYFSMPCKPSKVNGMRSRNLPEHDQEKWESFKQYCIQDVAAEKAIKNKISVFPIPEFEKKLWCLDQKINDTGILIDPVFVHNAIKIDSSNKIRLNDEATDLTELDNPNSTSQLKKWITNTTGTECTSLTKEAIPVLLKATDCESLTRVLNIRQEMAKTSVKKYAAMVKCICADNRVRGLVQFYGANRTGRWAGRLIQVQNLPKNDMSDLDLARRLVREGDQEFLELLFNNIPDTLSQLIRTSFVAPAGHKLQVIDFSAIEARVIAWLAGEKWRLEVFKTHGKIYEASASQMFKVPIETITKGSPLRQKGKVSELALGFGGGPNALIKMGALKMGIPEEELPRLVAMWRNANCKITQLWTDVEDAAMRAVNGEPASIQYGIKFFVDKSIFFIQLPSGRKLAYLRPRLRPNKFGGQSIAYEGMDQTTKQWCVTDTYGGKLVENIVQAIARDCLAEALIKVDEAGHKIVMHVHDEIVPEAPESADTLKDIIRIMSSPISWAPGLPLSADGYETKYYKKD